MIHTTVYRSFFLKKMVILKKSTQKYFPEVLGSVLSSASKRTEIAGSRTPSFLSVWEDFLKLYYSLFNKAA